ncbi:MAG TPA: LamG-like jellyroll fold domain-containing protein [Thermoanaerobaculia bacterium]
MRQVASLMIAVGVVLSAGPAAASVQSLRIQAWNLQQCRGTDNVCDLDRQARTMVQSSPDIILTSEIIDAHIPTYINKLNQLTGDTWHWRFVPICSRTTCDGAQGQGQAIFSKIAPSSTDHIFFAGQDRSAVAMIFDINGQRVAVVSTHLAANGWDNNRDPDNADLRAAAMTEMKAWAAGLAPLRILGGDFNFNPTQTFAGATELSQMTSAGYIESWQKTLEAGAASSYPDNPPSMATHTRRSRIDYIFYLGSGLDATSSAIRDIRNLNDTNVQITMGNLDDRGVRPSDHNMVETVIAVSPGDDPPDDDPPGAGSLVGHWKLDEGSGTTAADASGNGATGALINSPAWTAGMVGGALSFNGTNRVSIPNQPSWNIASSKYTVAFWVKVQEIRDYAGVVAVGNWGTRALEIMTTGNRWSARVNTSGGPSGWGCDATSSTLGYLTTLDDSFHHVALVLDAAASRCYLYSDGALVATDEYVDGTTSFGTQNLNIGGFGDANRLRSAVDDVRLYNAALTQAEVQALADVDNPAGPAVAGHWKLDDGSGTTAVDSSGSSATGMLIGNPAWTAGRVGGALSFDGTNRVSIPNQPSWNTASSKYTVAFWVKVQEIRNYAGAVAVGNWGTRALALMTTDNRWSFLINTSGGPNGWACEGTSPALGYLTTLDNEFHHVAVVLDAAASRCFLYSDGVLVATDEYVDGTTSFGTQSLNIGGFGDANRLRSIIDDVRLYTTALTQAEVQALAGGGT